MEAAEGERGPLVVRETSVLDGTAAWRWKSECTEPRWQRTRAAFATLWEDHLGGFRPTRPMQSCWQVLSVDIPRILRPSFPGSQSPSGRDPYCREPCQHNQFPHRCHRCQRQPLP